MGGECGTCGGKRGAYTSLVLEPEVKTPLGRPEDVWDDINIHLKEGNWRVWIGVTWRKIGKSGGPL
jgi:hypothetical protein